MFVLDLSDEGCSYDSRSIPALKPCTPDNDFLKGVDLSLYVQPVVYGTLLGAATLIESGYIAVKRSGLNNDQISIMVETGFPNAVVVLAELHA